MPNSILTDVFMRQPEANMEALVAEPANTSLTDNMGRRGLHFRQPREINVPKVLGEEVGVERRPAAAPSSASVSSSSKVSKFQPKLYIPERLRAAEQTKDLQQMGGVSSGSSLCGDQYSASLQEPSYYSSRVIHGRDIQNAPPEQNSSVLATSRGLFQLRPRRNIRVKSFDELESNVESCREEKREEPKETSYMTGFLKEQAANRERLARRGRHSISDMLGGTSTLSTAPSYDLDGYNPEMRQPYLATEQEPTHSQSLNMYSNISDGITSDSYLQHPADHATQHAEPQDVIAGITYLTENLNNLDMTSGEQQQAPSDQCYLVGTQATDHNIEDTSDIFLEKSAISDVSSYPTIQSHDPSIGDTSLRLNGYQMNPIMSNDVFNTRVQPSAIGIQHEETIDEKKERILRNLRQQKMASMAAARPSDPNFETLEEKKARIFAKLREKHGIEIQTEMLGEPLLPGNRILPIFSGITPSLANDAPSGLLQNIHNQYSSQRPIPQNAISGITPSLANNAPSGLLQNIHNPYSSQQPASQNTISQRCLTVDGRGDATSNDDGIDSYQVRHESHTGNENMSLRDETIPEKYRFCGVSGDVDQQPYNTADDVAFDNNYAQRTSPSEDMCSVDSGFHGGDMGREDSPGASVTPPAVQRRAAAKPQTTKKLESQRMATEHSEQRRESNQDSEPVRVFHSKTKTTQEVKVVEDVQEESNEETLVKPSAVKAAGSLLLKKTAPPATKPKPSKVGDTKSSSSRPPVGQSKSHQSRGQSIIKPQPPRPKSAPPNKSKSIANLMEVLPSPSRGRRASTSCRDDASDGASPFSRNSRLRSSTKAWEMRQAEKQAELRNRMASTSTKMAPRPQTPKKPIITGQISLSPERSAESAAAEKQKHTPRSSSNYEKPWRVGSMLGGKSAGSFLIRSAQPDKGAVPERPKKPLSNPSSRCSSRAASPSGRPRNPTKTGPTNVSDISKQKHK